MHVPIVAGARSRGFFTSLIILGVFLIGSVAIADIISGLSTTNSSTNVTITNLTLTKPSDVAQGDFMLASIAIHDGSAVAIAAPSGWTQILRTDNDTNISIVSYWKTAGASEPANYKWSLSPQTRAEGGITRYSGVDSSNPIDAAAGNTGRGTVATTSSITTTAADEEVVALFALHVGGNNHAGAFFSTPAGMTEKYDTSNTPAGPTIAADDVIQVAAGVVGSKSSTISGHQQRDWAAQQIALRRAIPGIAFDSAVVPACNNTQGTSCTWSHTVSGNNTLLVVAFESFGPDSGTGCTWNGTAMTPLGSVLLLAGSQIYAFSMLGASGTHNIICTQSNAASFFYVGSASYTGVAQSGNPEHTGTNGPSAFQHSFSQNATSSSDNAWGIWVAAHTAASITAGANTTLRTSGAFNIASVLDTNGAIHPAGSVTLNAIANANAPGDVTVWGGIIAAFAPAN